MTEKEDRRRWRSSPSHTGVAVPLRRSDVDTDQIIPAEYLKRVTRTGFEDGLFNAWRADPAFVLNDPVYAGATILVAGPGSASGPRASTPCGRCRTTVSGRSSRPRFGDIFRDNALKGGLLPVELRRKLVEELWDLVEADPTSRSRSTWSPAQVRAGPTTWAFPLDDHSRWRLHGRPRRHRSDPAPRRRHRRAFEATRPSFKPAVA